MIQKIDAFINFMISNGYMRINGVFTGEDTGDWFYYYDLSGHIDSDFYSVRLMRHKTWTDEVKISEGTDCIELLKWLLEEHGILKTT